MAYALNQLLEAMLENGASDLHIRVGIHTGPVVGGVIGETRMAYDYWGETMNIASRIEGAANPDGIAVSETTWMRGRGDRHFELPQMLTLKGVGEMPVYVSYDIDFVDPAYAPGTGTPEIGGPTSWQAVASAAYSSSRASTKPCQRTGKSSTRAGVCLNSGSPDTGSTSIPPPCNASAVSVRSRIAWRAGTSRSVAWPCWPASR